MRLLHLQKPSDKVTPMKNKKVMVGVVIGVAIVLILGVALVSRNSRGPEQKGQTTENKLKDGKFTGTFPELLALGENYACQFDTTDDTGNRVVGKTYIAASGDKFSGEFVMTQADGTEVSSNIMRDGEYNYIWTSEQEEGIKTKIDPEEDTLFDSGDETSGTTDISNDVADFDCQPWSVDQTMFAPPTNIKFTDLSSMMMDAMEGSQETESMMEESEEKDCSVCSQVPESSREQCLKAIGC